jgi:hypothetical protein
MELYLSEIEMILRDELRTMYCYGRRKNHHPLTRSPAALNRSRPFDILPTFQEIGVREPVCLPRLCYS